LGAIRAPLVRHRRAVKDRRWRLASRTGGQGGDPARDRARSDQPTAVMHRKDVCLRRWCCPLRRPPERPTPPVQPHRRTGQEAGFVAFPIAAMARTGRRGR